MYGLRSTAPAVKRAAAITSALAATLAWALALAQPAVAVREVPVGIYNVNNQVMNSASYVYALRFVPDSDTTLHRFISGFNLEGSDQLGGRIGYADGAGGTIRARLVAVKPNGEPDMSQVLAEETVSAWQRYQDSKAAYGAPGLTQLLYFNMGGVQLEAGQMYAMTYRNVDAAPSANWFSENSPTVKESVAGPNGTNTLDPGAPGAIAGLDSREAVAWSKDGGQTWVWGRRVGEGWTSGAYAGSATTDDGTRLPWYGWQTSAFSTPYSNQPYYAYKVSGSYTLRLKSAPRSTTLTEAGGYAPVGGSVGVVTVRNLATGRVGQTAPLGTGLVRGPLDNPVPVAAGQSYEISNSGSVLKAEGDSFIQTTFKVGSGKWAFETVGYGYDRAELFALPHPWFAPSAAEPGDTATPETSISSGPSGSTTSTSASFDFQSSESGSRFECRLDSGAWSACASPRAYSGLGTGEHAFEVRAIDEAANVDQTPARRTWTIEAPVVGTSPYSDKARDQPATASSSESSNLAPGYAVDGSPSTRWSSSFADDQWWQVDLGAVRNVDRVSINWEVAFASRYRVETSVDGATWNVAADVTISKKGRTTTAFVTRGARYVRMVALARATQWGVSFYDFAVYGPSDS